MHDAEPSLEVDTEGHSEQLFDPETEKKPERQLVHDWESEVALK